MRIVFLSVLLWSLLGWQGHAPFPERPNRTFAHGEYLKFNVHYGFINAGYADLQVKAEPVTLDGRACYHIVGRGWTNGTWDHIFKVRDRYESYLDRAYLIPWKFARGIHEGKFHTEREVQFRQAQGRAIYQAQGQYARTFRVPVAIHDVLSAFYAARARHDHRQLQVGDRLSLQCFLDRKTFDLEAELLTREEIKVKGQRFRALKFDLLIEEAGLMTDGSEIQFWISDDANKLPLRIESQLMIGSLKADLIEWRGLRHPFAARLDE